MESIISWREPSLCLFRHNGQIFVRKLSTGNSNFGFVIIQNGVKVFEDDGLNILFPSSRNLTNKRALPDKPVTSFA